MGNDAYIKMAEQYLRAIWKSQDTDVLFECFLTLLEHSPDSTHKRVQVIPTDNHSRNLSKDITPVPATWHGDVGLNLLERHPEGDLIMYTSRSSIVDYLPEEFIVEPDDHVQGREAFAEEQKQEDKDARRARIKAQQESAQNFFRPLEIGCNDVRQAREAFEHKAQIETDDLLAALWTAYPQDGKNWKRFKRTLHLIPYVIGDLEKTQQLIKYVLELEIDLELKVEPSCTVPSEDLSALTGNDLVLGYNMVLGQVVYDYQEVLLLRIGNLTNEQFFALQDEDSPSAKLLNEIIFNYFPLHVEVRPVFEIAFGTAGKASAEKVLGYSTFLGGTTTI